MIGGLAVALLLTGGTPPVTGHSIRWERGFEEALKKAKKAKKPVLVDFWADWCGWCHRLDETTYADPEVVRLSGDFVALKVNTEGGPFDAAVAARYDVESLPTILFLTPAGRPVLRVNGFQGPGQFPRTMEMAREMSVKVMAWESKLEHEPGHATSLAALGVHLFDQESYEESRTILQKTVMVDADVTSSTRKKVRLLLGVIQSYDGKYAEAESVLREGLSLRPVSDEYDPKLLYMLGKTYAKWGRRDEARVVWEEILSKYADGPFARKAREALHVLNRSK